MESRDMPIFTRTFDLLTWLLPAPMSDRFSEGFDTADLGDSRPPWYQEEIRLRLRLLVLRLGPSIASRFVLQTER